MPVLTEAAGPSSSIGLRTSDGPIEEWVAVSGGGFQRAVFGLAEFLQEHDLLSLYDELVLCSLYDLYRAYEQDRVDFLRHLKEDLHISKLADRQLLANALGRAKRNGYFDHDAGAAAVSPAAANSTPTGTAPESASSPASAGPTPPDE